jgi:hypothetical protein
MLISQGIVCLIKNLFSADKTEAIAVARNVMDCSRINNADLIIYARASFIQKIVRKRKGY